MAFVRSASIARLAGLVVALGSLSADAFDPTATTNVAAYWGQNSYGNGGGTGQQQQPINFYCNDNAVDVFPIAFVSQFFSTGGLPNLDMDITCASWNTATFPGTALPNCQWLASDIEYCQSKGKLVTISLGGGGANPSFSSDSQASAFADTLWNLFLGGSSNTRPLGAAVLDGVDLDIEGGSSAHFAAMVTQLRKHFRGASKPYYITAAPQCPFPDAYLGSVINAVGFDAVYVQFYNNYCATNYYPTDWDFSLWDNWAKNTSPNKNVKVYLGVAAAPTAADWGYVPISTLTNIIQTNKAQYSSFGGVMFWDMSEAYSNGRYDLGIRNALSGGSSAPPPPPPGSHELHPNGNTAKCLDVKGGVMANGTPVQIYDCNGTGAQQWVLNAGSTSVQVANTNYCLDAGTSIGNGVQLKIWTCYSGLAQQTWYYTDDKRIALENQGQCLDLTNGSSADGNVMQIWACTTNDNNQVWTE